jgi:hypothetical protein
MEQLELFEDDEFFTTTLLDFKIIVNQYGAQQVLMALLTSYPDEYMQLAEAVRGNPSATKVAALLRSW